MIELSKYVTISVPVEVKKRLEEMKGDKDWGVFLLETCSEAQRVKGREALKKLRQLLSDEDLEAIRQSSKEFRENFKLR